MAVCPGALCIITYERRIATIDVVAGDEEWDNAVRSFRSLRESLVAAYVTDALAVEVGWLWESTLAWRHACMRAWPHACAARAITCAMHDVCVCGPLRPYHWTAGSQMGC